MMMDDSTYKTITDNLYWGSVGRSVGGSVGRSGVGRSEMTGFKISRIILYAAVYVEVQQ